MAYTVKEIAELTGVTVKTLHHYHKIGLLIPSSITDAGYRMYGIKELERLQQILFYRELDFSLKDIQRALEDESSRTSSLKQQHQLLIARRERMDRVLKTIEESIVFARKGESMNESKMFKGLNQAEWQEVLSEQKEYLSETYEYEMDTDAIDSEALNEIAVESERFMSFLADALRNGWKPDDTRLHNEVKRHMHFLNDHNMPTDPKEFAETASFFVADDFHREMLESQQIGLSYYLYTVGAIYASKADNIQ